MFRNMGLHVTTAPTGVLILVGSVPIAMMQPRKPTTSDIMGGRVHTDGFAYYGKPWANIEEIKTAAAACGAKLCDTPGCACRKLF